MQSTSSGTSSRLRLNPFSRHAADLSAAPAQEFQQVEPPPQLLGAQADTPAAGGGGTFPDDEVVWGVAIRHGFDELDDPWHHRGVTQHAYLEGSDAVSLCGFRPPRSGPRARRRSRLGLPTPVDNPMCGSCARVVVAPRDRVAVPISTARLLMGLSVVADGASVSHSRALVPRVADPVATPSLSDSLLSRGVEVRTVLD